MKIFLMLTLISSLMIAIRLTAVPNSAPKSLPQ